MDDRQIDEHNAAVRAFENKLKPLVDGLTDDQCREIAIAMQTEHIGVNTIGRRMRAVLGEHWTEPQDIGAGLRLCWAAFARCDVYDHDFNRAGKRTLEEAFGSPIRAGTPQ